MIHGWRTQLDMTPVEAVRALEPFFGEFLYTHVDREGLMQGTDMDAIAAVKAATTAAAHRGRRDHDASRKSTQLDAMGVDAVVGMAIYTGRMGLTLLIKVELGRTAMNPSPGLPSKPAL